MKKKLFFLAAMTAAMGANAQEKIMVDGHEAVDLGLSVLWATENVSKTTSDDYFMWGDSEVKNDSHYDYNANSNSDVATQIWGEKWRTPTKEEFEELMEKCEWNWDDAQKGYLVENNGKSICLPALGYLGTNKTKVVSNGVEGDYWSQTRYEDNVFNDKAWILEFQSSYKEMKEYERRNGFNIRPVCEKSAVTSLNYVEKENANTVYKTIENGQIVIIRNGVKYNLRGQKL